MDESYGVAVASSPKRERPSMKIAHIRLRIDVSEEFANRLQFNRIYIN